MTRSLLLAALPFALVPALHAQAVELQELSSSDGAFQDEFGVAVALDGARALIGAELDNHSARTDAGSAYVFERNALGTWTQVAKLIATDRASSDRLGTAVALAGDVALLGADGDDDLGGTAGAAYVFERDAGGLWLQRAKLHAGDGASDDIFGDALALSGTRALVGAPGHAGISGAAYVFERDALGVWRQTAELFASDAAPGAAFGNSVALAGTRALVAAFSDDARASNAGAVYLFELRPTHPAAALLGLTPGGRRHASQWHQVAKLYAADASAGAAFGAAVALDGNELAVGAYGDGERGVNAGAAYVFARLSGGAWVQRAKLTAPDGAAEDVFGATLALADGRVLVSAVGDDDLGLDAGAAHVFARGPAGAWSWEAKLLASDGGAQDTFGGALALDGELALVGALGGDGAVTQSGTSYVFDVVP